MPTFARDGVELYYEIKGSGRPLMLVAGLAADNAFWLPSLPALSARHQVIVLDNRGAGRTAPLDAATSIRLMADDCMAAIYANLALRAGLAIGDRVIW